MKISTLINSVREQAVRLFLHLLSLTHSSLIGGKAYPDPIFQERLNAHQTTLYAPKKKPKGGALSTTEKCYNRLASRLRRPIESFFNWRLDKTDIQRASTVRSTAGLMMHCFGNLTFAMFLLVFNS